jgi:hypothetical protein
MTSRHERSLTYVFYRFHGYGLRSDADRFPFLPETLRRVAKKIWNRCCESRRPPVCVRLNQSRTNHYQCHCLGFCSGDAKPLAESGSGGSLRHHASHLDDARCDAETILGSRLIVGYSNVGQRLVAAEGTVIVEFDVPGERRGSSIGIERRRHLSSPRVSVDAVLE